MDFRDHVNQFLSDEEISNHIKIIANTKTTAIFVCICDGNQVLLKKLKTTPSFITMYDAGTELTKTGKELLGVYCYKDEQIEYITIDGRLGSHNDLEPHENLKPKYTKLLMCFLDAYLDAYFKKHGGKK